MRRAILGYVFAGLFFAIERLARRGERATSLEVGEADSANVVLIGLSYTTALLATPLLNRFRVGRLRYEPLGWLGVVIAALGTVLRVSAMRTLGEFYTRALLVTEEQRVVDTGPYAVVRHPGYAGSMMIWIGVALALRNWLTALVTGVLMLVAYGRRIRSEETMLRNALGEQYERYQHRTRRLVPFIY